MKASFERDLWIPLVSFSNRKTRNQERGNFNPLLEVLPKWVGMAMGCVFAYALLNFVYFIFCTNQYPKGEVPFHIELRGFSGHWMLFYGWASGGFVGLARREDRDSESEDF